MKLTPIATRAIFYGAILAVLVALFVFDNVPSGQLRTILYVLLVLLLAGAVLYPMILQRLLTSGKQEDRNKKKIYRDVASTIYEEMKKDKHNQ